MAEQLNIDRDAALHTLRLTFDAPALLANSAVTSPIEDFALLYRMSTGIYGRPGYRRFGQPFPYARPYFSKLHYGSLFSLEVIVPTLLVVGTAARLGLPKLLDLVEQILLLPSKVSAQRQENLRTRQQAELDVIGIQAKLDDPDAVRRQVLGQQRAEFEDAETRALRSQIERVELLSSIDSALIEQVRELYSVQATEYLLAVARRAQIGPVCPKDLEVNPVEEPGRFPEPPADLDRLT